MRLIAPFTLMFLLSIFPFVSAHQMALGLPTSFKIWGDTGKVLTTDQENIVCEMIELEYITQARSVSVVELSVKDESGQIIAKRIISSDGGNLHSKIGVSRWPEGQYLLQVWIEGEEETYSFKLVKNHLSLTE